MDAQCREALDRMFCPKSLAVVGATKDPGKWGGAFLNALLHFGYRGKIYPVNPSGGEAMGLRMFTSFEEIGEPVDLACICLPRDMVPQVLSQAQAWGVAGAEIMTAGFGESGDDTGRALEEEIVRIVAQGIRVLGPNCFGIYCPECGLTMLPGDAFKRKKGPVAFLSQSGGLSCDLVYQSPAFGIGFTRVVSYGNGCDIDETDLIDYFSEDPETEIIAGYIEGVRDGEKFRRVVTEAARKKPVVLWKAGLSETGRKAVTGHTGSMAGNQAIWEGLARQANVVLVRNMQQLLDVLMAFRYLPRTLGPRLSVIGGGGAISVLAADTAERFGLQVPPFTTEVREQLEQVLPPPGNSLRNPCDVGHPLVPGTLLVKLLEKVARVDTVDTQIVIQIPYYIAKTQLQMGIDLSDKNRHLAHHRDLVTHMKRIGCESGKPMAMVLRNLAGATDLLEMEQAWRMCRDLTLDAGIPVFPTMERALSAVSTVLHYYRSRESARTTEPS